MTRIRHNSPLPAWGACAVGLIAIGFLLPYWIKPASSDGANRQVTTQSMSTGQTTSVPALLSVTQSMQVETNSTASVPEAPLVGQASVIDGDTLEIHGERIRLVGIDAPESSQDCGLANRQRYPIGRASALALSQTINGRVVSCKVEAKDRYQRWLAACSIGPDDLNQSQVRGGWARAYRRYSDRYVFDEMKAGNGSLGLWACRDIEAPWDYRRRVKKT